VRQPATAPAPPPAAPPAPAPQPRAAASRPAAPAPQPEAPQVVGGFATGGNGAAQKQGHPAQAYGGIGDPASHRAYYVAVVKHEMAGAAGVREGDAMLRREIKRADNLTQPQKAKAMWRIRRANRRLAGTLEAAARAAAQAAKTRAEVNADILAGKRKRRAGGFTVT
jgi:hypothetical protein